jgi:hypothetical protein
MNGRALVGVVGDVGDLAPAGAEGAPGAIVWSMLLRRGGKRDDGDWFTFEGDGEIRVCSGVGSADGEKSRLCSGFIVPSLLADGARLEALGWRTSAVVGVVSTCKGTDERGEPGCACCVRGCAGPCGGGISGPLGPLTP